MDFHGLSPLSNNNMARLVANYHLFPNVGRGHGPSSYSNIRAELIINGTTYPIETISNKEIRITGFYIANDGLGDDGRPLVFAEFGVITYAQSEYAGLAGKVVYRYKHGIASDSGNNGENWITLN